MRLIHILSSSFWGGREQYALDICRAYGRQGWNVSAFTRDASAVDAPFREAGIRVRHLPLGGYSDMVTMMHLAGALRHTERGTVLHTHTFRDSFLALSARRLSWRRDIRVVMTCHRVDASKDTPLRRRILRNLHALIFPSKLAADTFLSTWRPGDLPLPEQRVHIIHNSAYLPEEPSTRMPSGPIVAAYYGRVVNGKGLETLIECAPALRGHRMRLCIAGPGDPDFLDSLKRLAGRLDVMDLIDWRGTSLSPEQVVAQAHIGLCPSLVPESFGQNTALFMAHGRPLIATRNGAQTEYLTDGVEALLIPPADREALTEALLSLADLPTPADAAALRSRLGAAAHDRFAATLSWPRFAAALTPLYTD